MTVTRHGDGSTRGVTSTIAELRRSLVVGDPRTTRRRLVVLDTLDWRVHRAGGSLVVEYRNGSPWLVRRDAAGALRHRLRIAAPPSTAADLPPGPLLADLEAAIADRRLLPLVEATGRRRTLDVLDARHKTVARLHVDRLEASRPDRPGVPLPEAVVVEPLRGFDDEAASLRGAVEQRLGAAGPGEIDAVLAAVGRRPLDTILPARWPTSTPARPALVELYDLALDPLRLAANTLPRTGDGPTTSYDRSVARVVGRAARRARVLVRELPASPPATDLAVGLREVARAARRYEDALGLERRLRRWEPRRSDNGGGGDAPVRELERALTATLERRLAAFAATLAAIGGHPFTTVVTTADSDAASRGRLGIRLARAWAAAVEPAGVAAAVDAPRAGRAARRLAVRLERALVLAEAAGPLARSRDVEATVETLAATLARAERLRSRTAWRRAIERAAGGTDDPHVRRAATALVARVDAEWSAAARGLPDALAAARRSRHAARLLATVTDTAAS